MQFLIAIGLLLVLVPLLVVTMAIDLIFALIGLAAILLVALVLWLIIGTNGLLAIAATVILGFACYRLLPVVYGWVLHVNTNQPVGRAREEPPRDKEAYMRWANREGEFADDHATPKTR